jgi:hypothetical protein
MPIVRRTRLFKIECGVCLVVLAVVVWSWDVSSVHRVKVVIRITTLTLCSLFTSKLHTTTASTTRQTPHAILNSLVLLTMGIMMPETY